MFEHKWVETENAEIIIINTCGVKHSTEQKILNSLCKMSYENKKVIVTGCLAHNITVILWAHPCASVLGVRSTEMFPDVAERLLDGIQTVSLKGEKKGEILAKPMPNTVIHPVAIQEGCLNACSYCFTKFARPHLVSFPLKNIKFEVEQAVDQGVKEIQLTGQDTGAYLKEGKTTVDVLNEICKVEGNFKVRLGMINPEHVKKMGKLFLDAFENEKMYKFFHLPLQSGSDDVLNHMRRRYTVEEFKKIVEEIRQRYRDAVLATDIIIGYPTETEEDFQKSMDLIRKMKFDVTNISMFSPRPFTDAAKLEKLKTQTIKKRTIEMSELIENILLEKNKNLIGKEFTVLTTEKGKKKNQVKARTNSYKQVLINKNIKLGSFVKVKIIDVTQTSLVGEVINSE